MFDTVTYRGWDHSFGGPWKCSLPLPPGWVSVKKTMETKPGDKCMTLTIPPKPLKNTGKVHQIDGKWELVSKNNVGCLVKNFRIVIKKT